MPKRITVVEVAMEIAYDAQVLEKIREKYGDASTRYCAMSNSVGGIGPLLRERIPAQAEHNTEIIGMSLLYENVWIQGYYPWGQIFIEKIKIGQLVRKVLEDTGISFELEMPDQSKVQVKVWKSSLGKATVYHLDVPEIASVVYPGPEDAPSDQVSGNEWVENQKLKQSWLIGRGTLALLKVLNKKPDFIIQSETPTFFANHFLINDSFQNDPIYKDTKYIFNDHTPLEYAHPVWNDSQIKKARIDNKYIEDEKYFNKTTKTIDITRLLIGVSDLTFGVSKKHQKVMRAMPSLKGLGDKIDSITNGIDVSFWQNADYNNYKNISDEELIAIKEKKKFDLIYWVWKRYHLWVNWRKTVQGKCFVNWTRRITTYKRFDVLDRLLRDPKLKERFLKTDLVILVGGRIHQNDNLSQNVMFTLLDLVTRDPDLKNRVVVLENYNIWDAPKIFHGIDATIMLADDGREASATGFMKAQVNGGVVIACPDGAIPESVVFTKQEGKVHQDSENGIEVPYVKGEPQPKDLMNAFEVLDEIYKDPTRRAKMIRASFDAGEQVNIDRVASEMIKYLVQLSNTN